MIYVIGGLGASLIGLTIAENLGVAINETAVRVTAHVGIAAFILYTLRNLAVWHWFL